MNNSRHFFNMRRRCELMANRDLCRNSSREDPSRVELRNSLLQAARKLEEDVKNTKALVQSSLADITKKLQALQSQATQLSSVIEALGSEEYLSSDDSELSSSPSVSRNLDSAKQSADPAAEVGGERKKRKYDRDDPDVILEAFPSTSGGATASSSRQTDENDDDISTEAVKRALRKTRSGVLSDHEFLSFLCICRDVDNPVDLAKVAFSADLERLYTQLLTFSFYLSCAHRDIEKEGQLTCKDLEIRERVQRIIDKIRAQQPFKRLVNNSDKVSNG